MGARPLTALIRNPIVSPAPPNLSGKVVAAGPCAVLVVGTPISGVNRTL